MNLAHLHLLLNHFPIIGTIVGLGLFLFSLAGKNEDLKRAALIIFAAMALLSLPTFFSGAGVQGAIPKSANLSEALISRHEGAAILALFFMEITGALSLAGLWQSHGSSRPPPWNAMAVLFCSLITWGSWPESGRRAGTFVTRKFGRIPTPRRTKERWAQSCTRWSRHPANLSA